MTSLATSLRDHPRRLQLTVAAAVLLGLVVTSWVTGVPFWTSDPVEVVGGGPPAADLAPPPIDGTKPLVRADVPATDDACRHLTAERVSAVLGAEVTQTGPCVLASASGGVTVMVETVSGAFEQAFVTEAEGWPQLPQVVSDPWSALFFIDAERSALLVDGGEHALVVRLTDATRDHSDHLDALTDLAVAALG